MSTLLHNLLRQVDVWIPLHWDCARICKVLLSKFNYVIEVSEHESMEWSDAAGGFVPVLGGWFCVVMRKPAWPDDYFPNEWETDHFNLPGRLSGSSFDYGDLERMLGLADAARGEFTLMGCSSVIAFRPGPHWLPRRTTTVSAPARTMRGAA